MHQGQIVDILDKKFCGFELKRLPMLSTCMLVITAALIYNLFYLPKISSKISPLTTLFLFLAHNTILALAILSGYHACTLNPGPVPQNLKFDRSALTHKFMQKRKKVRDQDTGHLMPKVLVLSDDEEGDDRQIDISQDTEDQESHLEEHKAGAKEQNRRSEKVQLVKMSKFHRYLTRFKYCEECDNIQPPRCEHCNMCGQCVLKMDHHCVYLGNCIGFDNHKHFILLLFYFACGCAFEGICYSHAWLTGVYGSIFDGFINVFLAAENLMVTMSTFSLVGMFFFTFLMVAKNTSYPELRDRSELFGNHGLFNLGTVYNIKLIMGDSVWAWFIPFKTINRVHNGIDYDLNPNRL